MSKVSKNTIHPLLFILHFSLFINIAFAQHKTDSVKVKSIATTNLVPFFGTNKNGSKVLAADIIKLLKANTILSLKDNKGTNYPVVSFEFTWRQKLYADDAITGKPKTTYNMVGQTIRGNKITADWIEEMTGLLKAGEDINFSTIIYFDAKKNGTFIAPSLGIIIL